MMRTLGYAVLAALSLLMAAQAGCEEGPAMREEMIRSKLVVGMDQTDVEAFFADHGIEYSLIPSEKLEGEQGLSRDPSKLGGRYVAIIRNVWAARAASEHHNRSWLGASQRTTQRPWGTAPRSWIGLCKAPRDTQRSEAASNS